MRNESVWYLQACLPTGLNNNWMQSNLQVCISAITCTSNINTNEVTRVDYPNGPEAGREAGWGSEFVPLKKREVGSFNLLHKISRTACCFGIGTSLKQYNCYESATNWYTDHQYLAQYSEIINNLQEIPLIFCNYAVRSCGTWRKGPGQSPCNGLSISDLELYVTETSTGVCDPVTD